MRSLSKRLEELERISAARRPPVESGQPLIEEIRDILRANNFAQGPTESLAETFARFLGISLRDLREQLMERAYGGRQHA